MEVQPSYYNLWAWAGTHVEKDSPGHGPQPIYPFDPIEPQCNEASSSSPGGWTWDGNDAANSVNHPVHGSNLGDEVVEDPLSGRSALSRDRLVVDPSRLVTMAYASTNASTNASTHTQRLIRIVYLFSSPLAMSTHFPFHIFPILEAFKDEFEASTSTGSVDISSRRLNSRFPFGLSSLAACSMTSLCFDTSSSDEEQGPWQTEKEG